MSNPSPFKNITSPLLISSSHLDNNTTIDYKVSSDMYVNSLTDGQATLALGFLKNLNDPISDDQAATKSYVDTFSGSANAGGTNEDIQINDGASGFTGTNSLIFNDTTGKTTLSGSLTNGVITLTGDSLTGVSTPVNPQDAANKAYVDSRSGQLTDYEFDVPFIFEQELTLTYDQLNNTFINLIFTLDAFPTP